MAVYCKNCMRKPYLQSVLYFLLILGSGNVWSQLSLNGIASYSQLSKEYYIVALYTSGPLTTVDALLDGSADKRVEIRITAAQWAANSFSQIWKRDLSINNDLSADAPQINVLLRFTDFPEEDLGPGDTIVANYSPLLGTTLTFNGETFLQAEGPVLFNYLLSVWVGPSPPSRQFKADLLVGNAAGDAGFAALLQRFQAVRMQPEREKLVSKWRQAEEDKARKLAAAKAAQEAIEKESAALLLAEETRKQQEQEEAKKRAELAGQAKQDAEAVAVAAAGVAAAAKARAAEAADKVAKARASQSGHASASSKEVAEAEALAAAEDEKARVAAEAAASRAEALARAEAEARVLQEKRLAQMSRDYEQAIYAWQIQRAVSKQVTYPEWARQFGEEGLVEADFVLDPQGQIIEYLRIHPDEGSLLAQELKAAIGRAAPFGSLPAAAGKAGDANASVASGNDKAVFKASYHFKLRGEAPLLTSKPVMPELLRNARSAALSPAQKEALLSGYQLAVQQRITESITYPHWAKSMKQTGAVEAVVTVAADGTVVNTVLVTSTRHVMLNDEVLKAVQRTAPFDPIPEELALPSLDVSVTYKFGGR